MSVLVVWFHRCLSLYRGKRRGGPFFGMLPNTNLRSVSVIVPVLNEGALLGAFLQRMRRLECDLEIIVVDGGSSDESVSIACSLADQVITAPRGRASQMNAGAAIARGEILWFVHADSIPPANAVDQILTVLSDWSNAGGCFSLRYPRREWIYRVSDRIGNIGVRVFGFALGDHGIFCRRSAFVAAGFYPIEPILEDAELYRGLSQVGQMFQVRDEIVTDPRAFERSGRHRTTAVYFLILALYVCGVPIRALNKIYRCFHGTAPDPTRGVGLPREPTPTRPLASALLPQRSSRSALGATNQPASISRGSRLPI
jgi:rSAM/selenodomain-associated transferase 2